MSKNLTKFRFILFFIFASFLLINLQANADSDDDDSNCCIDDKKCDEYVVKSESRYVCDKELLLDHEEYGKQVGCDDSSCASIVCQKDPTCCQEPEDWGGDTGGWDDDDDGWDFDCRELAENFCDVCGGTSPGDREQDSDADPFQLYSFFDLRDRESFVQVTNVSESPVTIHVQVFDVNNNCNENNFFDLYTGADTHIYNMRDILTNDSNPSGVLLPADAYGMVVFTVVTGVGGSTVENTVLVGNFRIIDNAGYEYRTNMLGIRSLVQPEVIPNFYFNYNIKGNVTLSDVVGMSLDQNEEEGEVVASPQDTYAAFDIDIFNINEVPFSCRDIIFACIDDDSPLLEQLLEDVGGASVASFEYGINNAIPHSKGGDLLCPGNNISDGVVVLSPEVANFDTFVGYIGLNNGNKRGSMDSFWFDNSIGPIGLMEVMPP